MIIPWPLDLRWRAGSFTIGPDTAVHAPPRLAELVRDQLGPATGFALSPHGRNGVVSVDLDADLGAEAYQLAVRPTGVSIDAGGSAGAYYAIQTLRQLLPPAIYRRAAVAGHRWTVPCVEISDRPRFRWRGGMLDVARHHQPKDFLFRFVDLLAMHKCNVLHLHLTDDQGWRFESVRYPRLTEVGCWRAETAGDGAPHGGFYSQDDLRELVGYAARRHVTVLPEIDMPGHMLAAIAAYPRLGAGPAEVATTWGVHDHILEPDEAGFRFCTDILDEVIGVFPGRHVHIGGDECSTTQWQGSERIRRRARELGLAGVPGLHSWFVRELATFLGRRGRTAVCWDDVLSHDPPPEVTIMAWQGRDKAGAAALRAGHDTVIASSEATYLDFSASADPAEPAGPPWLLPLEQACGFEPVPAGLDPDRVLGTQFQLWTEYMPTPADVEYKAFPRATAVAETAWSAGPPDYADLVGRLGPHLQRLAAVGVNYRPLDGPLPWQRRGGQPATAPASRS